MLLLAARCHPMFSNAPPNSANTLFPSFFQKPGVYITRGQGSATAPSRCDMNAQTKMSRPGSQAQPTNSAPALWSLFSTSMLRFSIPVHLPTPFCVPFFISHLPSSTCEFLEGHKSHIRTRFLFSGKIQPILDFLTARYCGFPQVSCSLSKVFARFWRFPKSPARSHLRILRIILHDVSLFFFNSTNAAPLLSLLGLMNGSEPKITGTFLATPLSP